MGIHELMFVDTMYKDIYEPMFVDDEVIRNGALGYYIQSYKIRFCFIMGG